MEVIPKFPYGLKKAKLMVINSGKEEKEVIEENVEEGLVTECEEYEYLGFCINQEGNCELPIEIRGRRVE